MRNSQLRLRRPTLSIRPGTPKERSVRSAPPGFGVSFEMSASVTRSRVRTLCVLFVRQFVRKIGNQGKTIMWLWFTKDDNGHIKSHETRFCSPGSAYENDRSVIRN